VGNRSGGSGARAPPRLSADRSRRRTGKGTGIRKESLGPGPHDLDMSAEFFLER